MVPQRLNKEYKIFQNMFQAIGKECQNRLQFLCQKVLSKYFDNDVEEPTNKRGIFWKVFSNGWDSDRKIF